MTLKRLIVSASLVLLVSVATPAAAAPEGEEAFTFTAGSGQSVEAFRGGFEAPENRADPDSRAIPIRYVRFPSTAANPGSPIVYLAGGPGGSGIDTAAGNRFPLFMAMREFGDVIALDQRGTGESNTVPACTTTRTLSPQDWADDEEVARLYGAAAEECAAWWEEQGVDLAGYTTVESAHDLEDLRVHLGAEKITLWGISYGTHLALAAMKTMDGRLDRVVLASAEGLDQTVKLPAYTDAYFERLQMAVDSQPDAAAAYPDVVALMRRVHAQLDAEPLPIDLAAPDGSTLQALLTRAEMQLVAARLIADPESAAALLALYAALDAEDSEMLAHPLIRRVLQAVYPPPAPITLEGMTLAMDVASGISPARLALVEEQGKSALLGLYLNFPMPQLAGVLDLDLGDAFRAPPKSAVPTLLLTGTLDGRTYPEEQALAVSGLTALTHVTVVNAGHNLFMTTPEVTEAIQRFMRGEDIGAGPIVAPLPPLLPSAPAP